MILSIISVDCNWTWCIMNRQKQDNRDILFDFIGELMSSTHLWFRRKNPRTQAMLRALMVLDLVGTCNPFFTPYSPRPEAASGRTRHVLLVSTLDRDGGIRRRSSHKTARKVFVSILEKAVEMFCGSETSKVY